MSAVGKKMGLVLVCADGRLHQEAVHYNDQLAREMGVDLVDVVAVPGPDGLFKSGREGERDSVTGWLKLLVGAHHPVAIAVVGHYQCAGNAVDDAEHDHDVAAAAAGLKHELGFQGPVFAFSTVWHSDERWSLKKIATPEATPSPIQIPAQEV
jgi:hypothetical protein